MSKELEKALELLRRAREICTFNTPDEVVVMDIEAFLASQQAEQPPEQATAEENAQVHPEQAEGAQGEPNGKWSRFDPTFVIEYLRHDTNFDADLIGQMLEFAISRAALAQPSPSNTVAVDRGALKMVINALRRDAEEGRAVRGEMADALEGSAQPSPAPELETQQPVAWVTETDPDVTMGRGINWFPKNIAKLPVGTKLYAAPVSQAGQAPKLLEWAVERWHAEVSQRPLINAHRRALDDTWRQVIRRLGGDAGLLCGPAHDDLLAAEPAQGGE